MAQSTKTVDTAKLNNALNNKVNALETTRKTVAQGYKDEKKVAVQGSPMYRPFFGNNMPIIINGVAIYVPLDGQSYEIPETFASVFQERIARIDEQERLRKAMANVQSNAESYAGERDLIKRA